MTNDDFGERAKQLEAKLNKFRENEAKPQQTQERPANNGIRYLADFSGGPITGLLLGYGFDSYFNTSPIGLLIFLLLGFAAGILNLYKASQNKN